MPPTSSSEPRCLALAGRAAVGHLLRGLRPTPLMWLHVLHLDRERLDLSSVTA
jgi:hypothetical protein